MQPKESQMKKMNEQRISVVVNTYNAERLLKRVLESVKDFDEIVVCDMESTDATVEIARQQGAKVVTFPKGNYNIVEPARQFAIDSASNEWVLVVDADELVTTELHEYLYAKVKEDDCPAGLFVPRKDFFMNRLFDYPDYQLRFLRKSLCHWPPTIHSTPDIDGPIGYLPKERKELAFIHLADDTISMRLKKTDLYTDNEVKKRLCKHCGTVDLVVSPLWRFVRSYFFKGGITRGKAGFINAVLYAFYKFITVAKIIENDRRNDIR